MGGWEAAGVFGIAFADEFLGIAESISVGVDLRDILAGDVEAVAVEPFVIDGRAYLFGVGGEDRDDIAIDGLEHRSGDEQADGFALDHRGFEFGRLGEAGEGGIDAGGRGIFAEIGVLADFVFGRELLGEAEDFGDEESAGEYREGTEETEEKAVVFSFEPFHGNRA